jgi:methionyl-tRNA formyltransferase
MGTPDYATTIFKTLVDERDIEVVSLITQEDKRVGRKQLLTPPHIKKFVLDNHLDIDIYQPKSLKSEESFHYIVDKKPDFIVVAAYGQILPKEILDIAPCINLHASILPKYRGASPIQSAILNREFYSGVTAMKMDEGLDTGDILAYSFLQIDNLDAIQLFGEMADLASKLIVKVIRKYDTISPVKQLDALSSHSKKIKKEDGLVRFDDAIKVEAKYRAFIFWPGVFLDSGLKLKMIKLYHESGNYTEGEIIEQKDESIIVGCKKGLLEIFRVQAPSKKEVDIISYIRGKRLKIGDILL